MKGRPSVRTVLENLCRYREGGARGTCRISIAFKIETYTLLGVPYSYVIGDKAPYSASEEFTIPISPAESVVRRMSCRVQMISQLCEGKKKRDDVRYSVSRKENIEKSTRLHVKTVKVSRGKPASATCLPSCGFRNLHE